MPIDDIEDAVQAFALIRARTRDEADEVADRVFRHAIAAIERMDPDAGIVWYGGFSVTAPDNA
ncbi:MAG: hypothetical protein ACXVFQ_24520 [Solirubrobacteraceae bacterium]